MALRRDTIVVDIDGTLADITHRLHYISGAHADYKSFFANVGGDALNEWCRELIRAFAARYRIVLVSGRPDSTLDDTRVWLARNHVAYHELHLVRRNGDFGPDHELKRAWMRTYGKDRILFAVEDRQRVVDMWRDEGVVCLQCTAWTEIARPHVQKAAPPLRMDKVT